jgi:hypothetical protein
MSEHHVTVGIDANGQVEVGQHPGLPVAGYAPQSTARIDAVNRLKVLEEKALREVEASCVDDRWAAIAKTEIQKAFMCACRSIFNPARIDGGLS